MKGKNNQETIYVVTGSEESFAIKKNTIYKVQGRFDEHAPDGLQRLGVAKIPFSGNGDRVLCRYDNMSNVYDTGFYSSSRCYRNLDRKEAEAKAKEAYENIGRPFAELTNSDITQSNYDFWDNYIVSIDDEGGANSIYDTGNPVDLFRLYIAVMSGKLMPEEMDGDPKYADAYYRVIDTTSKVTLRNEYELDLIKATSDFVSLLRGNAEQKQMAKDIAIFLGFYDGSDVEDDYLIIRLNNYLKEDAVNIKNMSRVLAMSKDPREYETLKICRMLAILGLRGRTDVTKKGFLLDGRLLGKERKSIADSVVSNPKKAEDKMFIIDAYDSLFREEEVEEEKK